MIGARIDDGVCTHFGFFLAVLFVILSVSAQKVPDSARKVTVSALKKKLYLNTRSNRIFIYKSMCLVFDRQKNNLL